MNIVRRLPKRYCSRWVTIYLLVLCMFFNTSVLQAVPKGKGSTQGNHYSKSVLVPAKRLMNPDGVFTVNGLVKRSGVSQGSGGIGSRFDRIAIRGNHPDSPIGTGTATSLTMTLFDDTTAPADSTTIANLKVLNVVADYGATGDGITDDTTSIQNAIDAAGTGDTVYFPPPAVNYKITTVTVSNKTDVTLFGNNSAINSAYDSLQVGIAATGVIDVLNCTGVTIKGLNITTIHNDGWCIIIHEGTGCIVRECNFWAGSTAIAFGVAGDATTGTYHKALFNNIYQYGETGIWSRTSITDNLEIAHHQIIGNLIVCGVVEGGDGDEGIEVWTGGTLIQGNTVVSGGKYNNIGISVGAKPYQQVVGNFVKGMNLYGIEVCNCGNGILVSNNVLIDNVHAISVTGSGSEPDMLINNNNIHMTTDTGNATTGISVGNCLTATITGNTITGDDDAADRTGLVGIYSGAGGKPIRQCAVTGCVFNGLAIAISLNDVLHPQVSNCTFKDVHVPIVGSNSQTYLISNCDFYDYSEIVFGMSAYFSNCYFYRNSEHPMYNKTAVSFTNAVFLSICGLNNCVLDGAADPMIFNAAPSGDKRPKIIQYSPTSFRVYKMNGAANSDGGGGPVGIEALFTAATGSAIPDGATITEWHSHYSSDSTTIKCLKKANSSYQAWGPTAAPINNTIWYKGDIIYNAAPSSGAKSIGWVCVSRVDSKLRVKARAADTTIEVDDTTGITPDVIGNICGVMQDNGKIKWTTCTIIDGNTLELADELDDNAAKDNIVYTYLFKSFGDVS